MLQQFKLQIKFYVFEKAKIGKAEIQYNFVEKIFFSVGKMLDHTFK